MLPPRLVALLGVFALGALPLRAQVSATVPLGYLILTAAAGTAAGATPSVLAFPLQALAGAAGQVAGPVTGVTASTITNANAGWAAGELSQEAAPYVLRFNSGSAAGRSFLLSTITANTATTVTLDPTDALGTDLTTLGIAAGDAYQLVPANTLAGVLGNPASTGVLGSAAGPVQCDLVQLLQPGGWISYYFDNASGHWRRASPPQTVADNVVIRPDTGVIYSRFAPSVLSITLTGAVPSVNRQAGVFKSGPTALANAWPTDLTLGTSSIQTMPGWISGPAPGVADTVRVYVPAAGWSQYYFDGTNWRLGAAPNTVSDDVALPAGTMVIVNKVGSAPGQALLSQVLPYLLVPTQ